MAVQVALEQEIFFGSWDLTAQMNAFQEALETEELDASVFKNTTKIFEPGLKGYGISGEGFWAGGDDAIDDVLFDQQRTSDIPLTIALDDGSVGSPAKSVLGMIASYQLGEAHGNLLKVSYAVASTDSRPVRGTILHNASASGNVTGTALQLGAVSATQSVYGVLHVFSGSGSFIVKIQSSSDEAFTSPNDRITFATVATGTARTYEWSVLGPGAITDTWWRITATNPNTRDFAVIAAIR